MARLSDSQESLVERPKKLSTISFAETEIRRIENEVLSLQTVGRVKRRSDSFCNPRGVNLEAARDLTEQSFSGRCSSAVDQMHSGNNVQSVTPRIRSAAGSSESIPLLAYRDVAGHMPSARSSVVTFKTRPNQLTVPGGQMHQIRCSNIGCSSAEETTPGGHSDSHGTLAHQKTSVSPPHRDIQSDLLSSTRTDGPLHTCSNKNIKFYLGNTILNRAMSKRVVVDVEGGGNDGVTVKHESSQPIIHVIPPSPNDPVSTDASGGFNLLHHRNLSVVTESPQQNRPPPPTENRPSKIDLQRLVRERRKIDSKIRLKNLNIQTGSIDVVESDAEMMELNCLLPKSRNEMNAKKTPNCDEYGSTAVRRRSFSYSAHNREGGEKNDYHVNFDCSPELDLCGGNGLFNPCAPFFNVVGEPVAPTIDRVSHPLFIQLDEMAEIGGELEWSERARWIRFEENVEEGSNKWGKPHVSCLSFHSLLELRRSIEAGSVLLDLKEKDLYRIAQQVVDNLAILDLINVRQKSLLLRAILLRHQHVGSRRPSLRKPSTVNTLQRFVIETARIGAPEVPSWEHFAPFANSMHSSHNLSSLKQQTEAAQNGDVKGQNKLDDQNGPPALTRRFTSLRIPNSESRNDLGLLKRIPHGAEAASVAVGSVDFLDKPIVAFVRLAKSADLNIVEVPIPVRFIFIVLGPGNGTDKFQDYKEIGRSMATLLANKRFHEYAYSALDRVDLLQAITEFLDDSVVFPPGDYEEGETEALLPYNEICKKTTNLRLRRNAISTEEAELLQVLQKEHSYLDNLTKQPDT